MASGNSPLRFGANALGQQVDMWLANAHPNSPSVNFTYPQNIIRNAVPEKDKKDGRENLKTEKVFNMTMEKVVANNHEVVTTEQDTGCSNGRNTPFDYT